MWLCLIASQVVDGEKAVPILGNGGDLDSPNSNTSSFSYSAFRQNIIQKARLALSIIVGNNKFNASMSAFQKPKINADDLGTLEHQHVDEQGASFRQHIHDVFMESFSQNMKSKVNNWCGVVWCCCGCVASSATYCLLVRKKMHCLR